MKIRVQEENVAEDPWIVRMTNNDTKNIRWKYASVVWETIEIDLDWLRKIEIEHELKKVEIKSIRWNNWGWLRIIGA